MPFDIPKNWVWCRLENILILVSGQDLTPEKYNTTTDGIPYITGASNIDNNENVILNRWTTKPVSIAIKDDLLITCKGTIGKMAFLQENKVHIARQIMAIRPILECDMRYIKIVLENLIFHLNSTAKSMIPGISRNDVLKLLLPFPPLAEQKRIVAKIEELEPLIEKYTKAETELSKLNTNFPNQLKKSILQYAIQGKLVPQNPEDEPANILLEKIRAEKQKLKKEKKIKKEKNESIIFTRDKSHYEEIKGIERCIDDEIPFEIPDNWAWCRLDNILILVSGQDLTPEKYNTTTDGIPYITGASNIDNNENVILNRWTTKPVSIAIKDDLLITCKGTIGKMAFLQENKVHIARQIMAIRPIFECDMRYIKIVLENLIFHLNSTAKSMIPGISRNDVLKLLLPFPPLAEQKRIVEKVEEIFDHINHF